MNRLILNIPEISLNLALGWLGPSIPLQVPPSYRTPGTPPATARRSIRCGTAGTVVYGGVNMVVGL